MYRVYLETSGNKPLDFRRRFSRHFRVRGFKRRRVCERNAPRQYRHCGACEAASRKRGRASPIGAGTALIAAWSGAPAFVSWCYGQMGLSEPRFAACQSQGIPWFTSRGQWGARGYENIAPGDAIFFDWDLDGSADHVGLVIGTDGQPRLYRRGQFRRRLQDKELSP